MKKKSDQTPGSALVPVIASLPAVAPVNISDTERARLEETFRDGLKYDFRNHGSGINLSRVTVAGVGGTIVGTTVVLPLAGLIVGAPMVLPIAALFALSIKSEKDFSRALNEKKQKWADGNLKERFARAQQESYIAQKRLVVAAAEQSIGAGRMLSLEDAAWIANLGRSDLQNTTDQLAITVLQIRKLLAHTRSTQFNSDGTKAVDKPQTFTDLRLDPNFLPHRAYLRERLSANDRRIEEDNYPYIQSSELVGMTSVKTGFWAATKNYLSPWSSAKRRRELMTAELPRYKDVEAQIICPVEDFAAALEIYEQQNPPLDLPAVRGWKSVSRKALPGPRSPL